MNSTLTYFLWIEDSQLNLSPDEEMEQYLQENCPIPTDTELSEMEQSFKGDA